MVRECEAEAVSWILILSLSFGSSLDFGYRRPQINSFQPTVRFSVLNLFLAPSFAILVLLSGHYSFSLRVFLTLSYYAGHPLSPLFIFLRFPSLRTISLALFLPPFIVLPISHLSLLTAQTYTDLSIFHICRFIVSDPNHNYVLSRFSPDAELMA